MRRRTWRRRILMVASGVGAASLAAAPSALASPISGKASPPSNALWAAASGGQILGASRIASGDTVAFWQGYLASYHMIACPAGMDGRFGVGTYDATVAMQKFFGVTPDGLVGPATWAAAGGWLTWSAGTSSYDLWQPKGTNTPDITYAHVFGNGNWKWSSPANNDNQAWHGSDNPGITFTNNGTCL